MDFSFTCGIKSYPTMTLMKYVFLVNQRQYDDFFFENISKKILRGRKSGGAFLKGLEGAVWGWGVSKGGRI